MNANTGAASSNNNNTPYARNANAPGTNPRAVDVDIDAQRGKIRML